MIAVAATACVLAALMCRSAALGTVFASAFVLLFGAAPNGAPQDWVVFALIAVACAAAALRGRPAMAGREGVPRVPLQWLVAVPVLAAAGWGAGMPRAVGPGLLAGGIVLLAVSGVARWKTVVAWCGRLGLAAGVAGGVLAAQGVVGALFAWANVQRVPDVVAGCVAALLRALGACATADGGRVLASGATQTWPFAVTHDVLATRVLLELTAGAMVWLVMARGGWRRYAAVACAAAGYAVIRVAGLILLYVNLDVLTGGGGATRRVLLSNASAIALSLLPLMGLWAALLRDRRDVPRG